MRSAFGVHAGATRTLLARATHDGARVIIDEPTASSDLRRLHDRAANEEGAADVVAIAYDDDVTADALSAMRAAAGTAGFGDALFVAASTALLHAGEIEGEEALAIGAARWALLPEERRGAGAILGGGTAGGAAAGAAAGVASRAGGDPDASMSDFGDGRDMSQFGEGSQMSDFGDRSMSDFGGGRNMSEFGEGRDMSEFGRQPQQPAAAPPPPVASPAPPPPPEPVKSKAKVAIAAAVVVAVIAVVAVVALASNNDNGESAVTTGGAGSTIAPDSDDESPATDDEGSNPEAPTAGGPLVFFGFSDGPSQIFTADADGSNLRQVSKFGSNGQTAESVLVEWAPDGRTIYYTGASPEDSPGSFPLWAMNADGSNIRQLAADVFSVDAAPDGRLVVMKGGAQPGIAILDATGALVRTLTTERGSGFPTWAPDGSIFFTRNTNGGREIVRVQEDGSGMETVVTGLKISSPVVSPDGKRLAWLDIRGPEDQNLIDAPLVVWAANVDGSDARIVWDQTGAVVKQAPPAWSKNGQFLVLSKGDEGVVLFDPESEEATLLMEPSDELRTHTDLDVLTTASVEAVG